MTERVLRAAAGDLYLGEKEGGGRLYVRREDLETHAHFLGPTGTGKTRALRLLAQHLIDAEDCSVVVLDPHDGPPPYGGLYHGLKSYCYDRDHADRLITIDPQHYFQHGLVAGFNPLSRGRSPVVRAGLAVEHLRAVCGHTQEGFASQPMLARWGFNTFLGLIALDLAMADAARVLSPEDPTYREGLAELLTDRFPDVAADWRWLSEQERRGRARDVLDEKLGSTTTRLRFYTTTEVLKTMLSTRERVVDPERVLREKQIVLANLNPRGFVLEEDQRMLGVQLLHAFCRAAMERTDEGAPCYVIVDEFSKFLTPEILEILDGGRKFGIHLILAHQHLSQLQQAAQQDWRYYHAVLTNARVRVVFGGLTPGDTSTMAEHLYGAHLDPMKVKQEIYRTIQTSHVEWMTLRTETRSTGHSRGNMSGASSGSGQTSVEGKALSGPWQGMDPVSQTFSQGYAAALSAATMSAVSEAEQENAGEALAHVPVILPSEPRLELGSREFMALEEQLYLHAQKLRGQPNQHAIFQVRGDYPVPFRVGDVPNPSATTDELARDDEELLRSASWAVEIDAAEEETRSRDRAFRDLVGSKALPAHAADPIPDALWSEPPKSKKPMSTRKRRTKS